MISSVNNLSGGLATNYEKFQSVSKLTTENMFQMLSLELGGDGEKITKKQLNTYIEDAKDGTVDISNQELDALKDLQENWNAIAGKDTKSITYKNMGDYRDILFSAVAGGLSVAGNTNSVTDDVGSHQDNSELDVFSTPDKDTTFMLETLLKGIKDKNNDTNANLIDMLVNIIASYDSNSKVDLET